MKLAILFSLAVLVSGAGAASAQTPPPGPLDRTQKVGDWTVSDTGSKPGDDSERDVMLTRTMDDVVFYLHRSGPESAGINMKFSRCDGLNWNSGLSVEGGVPARVAAVKDEIHDAFKDFAKMCPPKAGEEAALLAGFDEADRLVETWIHDRPFVYPPEPPDAK